MQTFNAMDMFINILRHPVAEGHVAQPQPVDIALNEFHVRQIRVVKAVEVWGDRDVVGRGMGAVLISILEYPFHYDRRHPVVRSCTLTQTSEEVVRSVVDIAADLQIPKEIEVPVLPAEAVVGP